MLTKYIRVDRDNFESSEIEEAADSLRRGELVAFPTETVYGLGAVFNDETALKNIFLTKGRPMDNPLIVHIWDPKQLVDIVAEIDDKHQKLIDAFWPGPLTLIFPRKPEISNIITAGLSTVAVRMPSHPVAAELLRLTNIPVAAPSANLSGKPSPTKGEHVLNDFDGKVPFIIDGGECDTGLESTVLLINGKDEKVLILRPGAITREMLEEVLGESVEDLPLNVPVDRPQAPGMKYRHYAPQANVVVVEGDDGAVIAEIEKQLSEQDNDLQTAVICFDQNMAVYQSQADLVLNLGPKKDLRIAAKRLFDLLRYCDKEEIDQIYVEGVAGYGVGVAVCNRLYKAAGGKIIHV